MMRARTHGLLFMLCMSLPVLPFVITFTATAPAFPPSDQLELRVPAQVSRVYDGDTFTVDAWPWPGVTVRTSVRIDGLDTPEIRGKCPEEKRRAIVAREHLKALLGGIGSVVALEAPKAGKYAERVIARVTTPEGQDVTEAMLLAGHGRLYDGGRRQGWCEE